MQGGGFGLRIGNEIMPPCHNDALILIYHEMNASMHMNPNFRCKNLVYCCSEVEQRSAMN